MPHLQTTAQLSLLTLTAALNVPGSHDVHSEVYATPTNNSTTQPSNPHGSAECTRFTRCTLRGVHHTYKQRKV